jgi:hypothetical protein
VGSTNKRRKKLTDIGFDVGFHKMNGNYFWTVTQDIG